MSLGDVLIRALDLLVTALTVVGVGVAGVFIAACLFAIAILYVIIKEINS